jgi:outer membrane receptor for ferrienterochelin and colicin
MDSKFIFRIFIFCCTCTFFSVTAFSQENVIVSGFVSDNATGERLAGATVFDVEKITGTNCNQFGFYSLSLPLGKSVLLFRFVGFDSEIVSLDIFKDTVLNISLTTNNIVGEVEVKAPPRANSLLSPTLGMHRLTGKEIEKIPAVLGEPDLLKAIQLLPGVSFATEGSTGFSVRGGNPDQTLILLDGVPVYNVNHLWGFMSAFNNDAISGANLYKGSLSARFGGRLSSVLDVGMKEGNLKKQSGTFSLSPIAGHLTLEGPIVKDKASFMVSGRTTWANLLLLAAQRLENTNSGGQVISYGFWDINAKTNYIVNQNNRIYLSFYTGRDAYIMEDDGSHSSTYSKFSYNWQNLTGVMRWNHIFSPVLFANFSLYNSRFRQEYYNQFDKKGDEIYIGYNNLNDLSQKGDFDWLPRNSAHFKFGYNFSLQKFSPEIISYKSDSASYELNKDIFTNNFITELYAEVDIDLTEKLKGNFGLRGGSLATEGKNYWSLRPRVSLRYLLTKQVSAKISYSRMTQYLHQLQNTTLGIPTELWVSSTNKIKPGNSDLFSTGIFWQPNNQYRFSSEVFYTNLKNILQYKDGTLVLKERDDSWEDFVATGTGKAYGLELMTEKITGSLTGWVAYTLSKSTRQFDEINFGETFPYAYDRRHQLNINANYLIDKKLKKGKAITKDISATFNYASGNNITLATQEYQAIPLPLMESSRYNAGWFEKRSLLNTVNNYKMPDFHNLNLSYRIERQSAEKTIVWNFSVYNVYNRLNPWYYYQQGDKMKQITLFPIIPSVSYTYKW